jgi:hypothetical protein
VVRALLFVVRERGCLVPDVNRAAPTLTAIAPPMWGLSGTRVTITGSNFGSDITSLRIANPFVVSYTWMSVTQVIAIAPPVASASVGPVVLNATNGNAVGLSFTYLAGAYFHLSSPFLVLLVTLIRRPVGHDCVAHKRACKWRHDRDCIWSRVGCERWRSARGAAGRSYG